MEKKAILIVEDEQISALDLRETLTTLGYRVTGIANTGEKAIVMADTEVPDLILMDIRLAGNLSGIEAAEKILEKHNIPIIYLTAYADPELVEKAKQTRPYGYIIKPYDERGIRTEIEIALHKFELDQDLKRELANLEQRIQERTTDLARANEALKKSEVRYRLLFERSGEGIFIFEAEGENQGKIVEVNTSGAAMHGYSIEELLQMMITDLDVPENLVAAPSRFKAILNGEWIGGEMHHIRKDGFVFPIDFQEGLLELDGHRYVFSVIRDITERKKAEEKLRTSKEQYSTLAEAALDPIFIIGRDDTVLYVNTQAARMLNLPVEQIVGKPRKSLFPPDIANEQVKNLHTVFNTGKPLRSETEIQYGNSKFWQDNSLVPLKDKTGNVTSVLGISRDNTDRKRAENALRESEANTKALLNAPKESAMLIDIDGIVIAANETVAERFGTTVDSLIGKNIYVLLPQDLASARKGWIDKVVNSKKPVQFIDLRFGRPIDNRIYPILDAQGNVTRVAISGQDISERKQLEDALTRTNKKLNLLSSITRHDIRNQLHTLKAYLELSKESLGDTARILEYIRKEERAANAIELQIVFTKEYENLGVNAPAWQNVDTSVKESLAALPMRDIRVSAEVIGLEAYADPLFGKVFYNLIDNALRYGGPKMTTIRIFTKESEKGLVISVEDDGTGISAEDKKHLFERGFGHCTGLGLFLSRDILSITGIKITETGEPGKGARFEITVPKGAYRLTGAE